MINCPLMKPIRNTLTARLGNLKMYREEADQLIAFFRNSCESFVIAYNNNSFDDLDDMKNNIGTRVRAFYIRGVNPAVRFSFNQSEMVSGVNSPTRVIFNELRTEEMTDAADALFYKIKDFLLVYQRPRFRKGYLFGVYGSVVGLLMVVAHYGVVNESGQDKLPGRAILGLLLFTVALGIFLNAATNIQNYLSLESKRKSASFFVKYREDFARHAVQTVIASVITGIIGYLIGHYLK
jgi:hypothetical protein